MVNLVKKYLITLLMVVGMMVAAADGRAAGDTDARQFVDSIGQRVLHTVNESSGSEGQKQQQLKQMFADNVDIPWMGQFVLGRAWQEASQQQRDQYLAAYKDYLLAHYTTNFTAYTGAKYTITDVKPQDDNQYVVGMQIKAPKQSQDTMAGYRVRPDSTGQFKITDIIVEGVSLITTQRSEFASVVQKGGLDMLIKDLQDKKQSEQAKS